MNITKGWTRITNNYWMKFYVMIKYLTTFAEMNAFTTHECTHPSILEDHCRTPSCRVNAKTDQSVNCLQDTDCGIERSLVILAILYTS